MHPAAEQRLSQRLGDVILTLDLGEAGRTVPPIQRERRGGQADLRNVSAAWALTGTGGAACHDLILAECTLAGTVRDPPHTRQSPRTLAAFRPWGGWRDERRARGLAASLTAALGVREPAGNPVADTRRRRDDARITQFPAQTPQCHRHRVRERVSELIPDLLE